MFWVSGLLNFGCVRLFGWFAGSFFGVVVLVVAGGFKCVWVILIWLLVLILVCMLLPVLVGLCKAVLCGRSVRLCLWFWLLCA